jgi:hypothetical protein
VIEIVKWVTKLGSIHLHITNSSAGGEFYYEVIILRGQNIELRINFEGSLIPASIRVYIKYHKENSNEVTSGISPGMYTNATDILIAYIPSSFTPSFARFRVMIALGTDRANIGPYRSPTKDIVYGKLNVNPDTINSFFTPINSLVTPLTNFFILITLSSSLRDAYKHVYQLLHTQTCTQTCTGCIQMCTLLLTGD